MATGYTASIYKNKGTTFEEFVWHCARSRGALYHLRDEADDVPTLAQALSNSDGSDWHQKELSEAQAHLAAVQAMTPEEVDKRRLVEHDEAWKAFRRRVSETNLLHERYQHMLDKVKAWQPPSADHENLRAFMIQQLEESIRWDCYDPTVPTLEDLDAYRQNLIDRATRDVTYHTEEREKAAAAEERKRAWILALHSSVPNPRP